MKKSLLLLIAALLLVCISEALAQDKNLSDGTIVKRTPCPAYAGGTYEEYVEAARTGFVPVMVMRFGGREVTAPKIK